MFDKGQSKERVVFPIELNQMVSLRFPTLKLKASQRFIESAVGQNLIHNELNPLLLR